MDIVKLKARPRTGIGKSCTRKIRATDWIPAVYYGHNLKTENIEVSAPEFRALVRARKQGFLIDLGLPGSDAAVAVVKEIQRDPIRTMFFLHIDFQHVSMTEKITVQCRVEVTGVPVGVKEEGGILEHPVKELTIECLPMDIPEKIVVDVGELKMGDSIHVKDLSVPKVTIKNAPEEVVALVARPTKEEEIAAPAPAEGVEGAAAAEGAAAEGAPAVGAAPAAGADAAGAGAKQPAAAPAAEGKKEKKREKDKG